ncbi:hypothetical protein PENTCL1PPCAC_16971, partial [Pristionchus entomophagus]
EPTTSCRKCRYRKFCDVLNRALEENAKESEDTVSDKEILLESTEDGVQTTFIDHTTYLESLHDLPSCSNTPLLDKIRWSYSLMCLTRKSGETATKPSTYNISEGEYDGSDIKLVPATYSMVMPNVRIFAAALSDFAKAAFPDFAQLNSANKRMCIANSFHHVSMLDSTYRSAYQFPDDLDTYFASYTTIFNFDYLQSFLDDCPFETNAEEALEALAVSMRRMKTMNREVFHRVKPDDVEFLALLGLSFWNNEVAMVNEELSIVTERNRANILKEMHSVYESRGKTDYATRLGELFCLLDNAQENVNLTTQDIEVYRLLNIFNE